MIKKNNDGTIILNYSYVDFSKKNVEIFFDCDLFLDCLMDKCVNDQLYLMDYGTGLIYKLPFNTREKFFHELLTRKKIVLFPTNF